MYLTLTFEYTSYELEPFDILESMVEQTVEGLVI